MDSLGRERGKECGCVKAFDRPTGGITHERADNDQKKTAEREDVEVKQQAHRVQVETEYREMDSAYLHIYVCAAIH